MNNWTVYLLRCSDNSLYCGVTNNLKKRLTTHNAGKASKYTRGRLPVELVKSRENLSKSDAYKLEYRIKRLSKNKKIGAFS